MLNFSQNEGAKQWGQCSAICITNNITHYYIKTLHIAGMWLGQHMNEINILDVKVVYNLRDPPLWRSYRTKSERYFIETLEMMPETIEESTAKRVASEIKGSFHLR